VRDSRFSRAGGLLMLGAGGSLAALLAGGGLAQAAAHQGGAAVRGTGSAAAGVISTVAGGVGGPGRATRVDVSYPCGVSFGAGAVYIAGGQTVRRVNPATDWLTTPAGTDALSPVGDGGPATSANVETCGTATDHDGSLLIVNFEDQRIQVVAARSGTFYGQAMTAGTCTPKPADPVLSAAGSR
jgi:hypothetical protein